MHMVEDQIQWKSYFFVIVFFETCPLRNKIRQKSFGFFKTFKEK